MGFETLRLQDSGWTEFELREASAIRKRNVMRNTEARVAHADCALLRLA
jgi:hypothetical protein